MEGQSRRLVYLLIGAASIFIIIWGIRESAYIINPILLAAVITITVLPIPGKLQQRGLPGWLSLVLTIVLVVGGLVLVLGFSAYAIGKLAADLPSLTADAQASGTTEASQATGWLAQLQEALGGVFTGRFVSSIIATIVAIVARSVFQAFIVLLIFGFMLSAAIALPRVSRAGLDSEQEAVRRVTQFTGDIRQYVTVMTLVNFLVGLGNTILLWIVGVPYAVLWGLLAWFLGYIPSVGFWLALIPPVILAYVEQGAGTALFVFLAYVLINGGVQNLVQPRLMGQSLNISPLVVFISVFVWAWLLGGIGAILAVPLTLLILEVLNSFDSSRWLVTLMRYAPDEESEDREHAQDRLKDLWQRVQTRVRNLEGGDAQLDQEEPA